MTTHSYPGRPSLVRFRARREVRKTANAESCHFLPAIAGRIADQLKARFGEDFVFMDIDNIPLGVDYRVHIRGELLKSEILIVVIGPRWLAPDPDGASMPRTSWAA